MRKERQNAIATFPGRVVCLSFWSVAHGHYLIIAHLQFGGSLMKNVVSANNKCNRIMYTALF